MLLREDDTMATARLFPPRSSSLPTSCRYGRGAGVGRGLVGGLGLTVGVGRGVVVAVAVGVGVKRGVAVGVEVVVGVGVEVGVKVAVAVGVLVGVGVGVSPRNGAWIATVIGEPVLKNPTVALMLCGGTLASNRKLYTVPQRIALAFWFCANVSQLQVMKVLPD